MHPIQGKIHTPPVGYYFNVTIVENTKGAKGGFMDKAKAAFKVAKTAVMDSAFQEISGLKASISPEPIISGGDTFAYQVPKGNVTFEPLLLQRGLMTVSSPLQDWCKECLLSGDFSNITTKNVVVTLLNPSNHRPVNAWVFFEAYPVEYEISGFNAKEGQIMVEKIKLVYRNFQFAMDAASETEAGKKVKDFGKKVGGKVSAKLGIKI